jgi:hypothetical protein
MDFACFEDADSDGFAVETGPTLFAVFYVVRDNHGRVAVPQFCETFGRAADFGDVSETVFERAQIAV